MIGRNFEQDLKLIKNDLKQNKTVRLKYAINNTNIVYNSEHLLFVLI